MDYFSDALNDILVDVYQNIMFLEQQTIRKKNINLSINEMHMIEHIGKASNSGLSISEIAEKMNITRPVSYTHLMHADNTCNQTPCSISSNTPSVRPPY